MLRTPVLIGDDSISPVQRNLMDSSFLFLAPGVDVYFPPRKRSRVTAPFVFFPRGGGEEIAVGDGEVSTIDTLPDECLFEILRRIPGKQERAVSACVSKRWLLLLANICSSEISAAGLNRKAGEGDEEEEGEREESANDGFLTRRLQGKEATDVRLAAVAVGTGGRGGLGKLFIRGSNPIRGVTDAGLAAVARGCPSLRVLSLWNVPMVGDKGLSEIANGCPMLEKLDLSHCPMISDRGLVAIARKCPRLTSLTIDSCSMIGNEGLQAVGRCCPNLQTVSIMDCPLVGDQGVGSLVSSASSSLTKVKIQNLNITDASLAVLGHYGRAISELVFTGLQNVSEKGFWVMGHARGLQMLKSFTITSCRGATDLSLEAVAKGCPILKRLCLRGCCFLSDAGLRAFAGEAGCLENLRLEECNGITLVGILGVLLACTSKLQTISLVKCMGIKDIVSSCPTQLLLPSCDSLRSLSICDCPGFGSSNLAMVGKLCPKLQHVDLSGLVGVTDDGLLPLIESCDSGLVKVNLSGCVNVTDSAVSALARFHGGTLEILNLEGCRKVTDDSVLAIADNCSLLVDLDVSKCEVTDRGVAALASASHLNLRVLSLSGCSKISSRSLAPLGNFGRSLVGLNLQKCNLISTSTIGSLEEDMWWCDILS